MNDLSDLAGESVALQTSAGPIRLYPQRFEDIGAFSKLPPDDPPSRRLRDYLPQIATHDAVPFPDRERDALDESFCQRLSDEDIERIAEVYLSVPAVVRAVEDASLRAGVVARADAETSSHYLDRVLRAEHERQMEDLGGTYSTFRERFGAPLSTALGDLDRQASRLKEVSTTFIHGHQLGDLNRVPTETRSIEAASIAHGSGMAEAGSVDSHEPGAPFGGSMQRDPIAGRSEREAEVELTRNIGWMTAQSANLLANLSESATQFLRQFADAAASSDAATRRMLRVALGGIIVAALLSASALGVALLNFLDQREQRQADAQWRAALAKTLKDDAAVAGDHLKGIDARLQHLSDRQAAAASSSAPGPAAIAPAEPAAVAHRESKPPASSRTSRRKGTPTR